MTAGGFAAVAQALAARARELGLRPPSYRGKPEDGEHPRSIFRNGSSSCVSVTYRGRPDADVVRDLVVGTLRVNDLDENAWDLDLLEAAALEALP